jgi:hypothetical protein
MPPLAITPQHCNFGVISANHHTKRVTRKLFQTKGLWFCSFPKRKDQKYIGKGDDRKLEICGDQNAADLLHFAAEL